MTTWMSPGASRTSSASAPRPQVRTRYSIRKRSWTDWRTSGSSSTTRSVGRGSFMPGGGRVISLDQGHFVPRVVVSQLVDHPPRDHEPIAPRADPELFADVEVGDRVVFHRG